MHNELGRIEYLSRCKILDLQNSDLAVRNHIIHTTSQRTNQPEQHIIPSTTLRYFIRDNQVLHNNSY